MDQANGSRHGAATRAALYNPEWLKQRTGSATKAAATILPIVWSFIQPKSIVDVGCGRGEWLAEARRLGVERYLGIDGPWSRPIDSTHFVAADIEDGLPEIDETFDLAFCLEFAEHVSASRADEVVAWLVKAAPVILFSAAIPFQGGTGHVNEAWMSAWEARFARSNYRLYDVIRPAIWNRADLPFWYRQNVILAIRSDHWLAARLVPANPAFMDFVHPELWRQKNHPRTLLRRILGRLRLPGSFAA